MGTSASFNLQFSITYLGFKVFEYLKMQDLRHSFNSPKYELESSDGDPFWVMEKSMNSSYECFVARATWPWHCHGSAMAWQCHGNAKALPVQQLYEMYTTIVGWCTTIARNVYDVLKLCDNVCES